MILAQLLFNILQGLAHYKFSREVSTMVSFSTTPQCSPHPMESFRSKTHTQCSELGYNYIHIFLFFHLEGQTVRGAIEAKIMTAS